MNSSDRSLQTGDTNELVIEPRQSFEHYWRDLWRYRELLYILAWRDVAVRYKQTVAGAGWAIVQPLINMVIMTLIFNRVAGLPAQAGAPYPIMVCAAVLPWQFFANALMGATQSVLSNSSLVSKVYFPRLIIPTSPILVSLVDAACAGSILVGLMVWFQFWPTWRVLVIPGLIVLAVLAALGPGLIATALTVRYRDVRFIIPFVVQVGLYVSPVAYSTAVVQERVGPGLFLLYSLNPMVAVIDGFRWALLGGPLATSWASFLISLGSACVLLAVGLAYFRSVERSFGDLV